RAECSRSGALHLSEIAAALANRTRAHGRLDPAGLGKTSAAERAGAEPLRQGGAGQADLKAERDERAGRHAAAPRVVVSAPSRNCIRMVSTATPVATSI